MQEAPPGLGHGRRYASHTAIASHGNRRLLGEIDDWRQTHTLTHGSVGLAVLADRVAELAPVLRDHVRTMADLSPTLRAALRGLETRQGRKGGAS